MLRVAQQIASAVGVKKAWTWRQETFSQSAIMPRMGSKKQTHGFTSAGSFPLIWCLTKKHFSTVWYSLDIASDVSGAFGNRCR